MLSGEDYMQVRREAACTGGQWNSTADDQKLFTVEEMAGHSRTVSGLTG